jgi:hypothetical protein
LQGEHDRLERRSVAAAGELEQVPDELRLDRRRTALQFRRVVLAQCLAVDADDVRDLVLRIPNPDSTSTICRLRSSGACAGRPPQSCFHAVRYEIAASTTSAANSISIRTGKTP